MLRAARRPGTRFALTAVAAGVAAAVAGCGGGPSDEQRVAAAVNAFARATVRKDYAALCQRILAPALVRQVAAIGLPCPQALARGLGGVRAPRLSIGHIRVDGDRATAQVRTSAANQPPSRDTLRLVRVGGGWRIASLGR